MKCLRFVVLGVALLTVGALPPLSMSMQGAVLTVTTTDNDSTAEDGRLSLLEALRRAREGDSIHFNLAGAGPHRIQTPLGGYPFIRVDQLTIDGFTQPGSRASAVGFAGLEDMKVTVFLDSSSADEGETIHPERPDLISRRSTRMLFEDGRDIPGYGDSENGILAVLGADGLRIRGLGFLGRHTPGNTADPLVYAVALAKEATRARIQGCWFGFGADLDSREVLGFRAAVAAFRHRVRDDQGQNVDTFSSGLIYGVDGDGVGDAGEGNVAVGMELALALELNDLRISGNYFNLFPDGRTFLDVDAYATLHQLGTMETLENGRSRHNMLIGTDGDGISDRLERNVFGPSKYKHLIEIYGGNVASNVVVAGNHYGVAADGVTGYPHSFAAQPDFLSLAGAGSIRIGSNGDGVSDDVEANLIQGIRGARFVNAGYDGRFVIRGNRIRDCGFLGVPFAHLQDQREYQKYYEPVLGVLDGPGVTLPVLSDYFGGYLNGTIPVGLSGGFEAAVVDVYEKDSSPGAGGSVPGRWVGRWVEGSTQDLDPKPGSFSFRLDDVKVGQGVEWVAQATYTSVPQLGQLTAETAWTGPLSEPLSVGPQAGGDSHGGKRPRLAMARAFLDEDVLVGWVGDRGVWLLESASHPRGPYAPWVGGFQYVPNAPRGSGHYEIRLQDVQRLGGGRFFRLTRGGGN